jgi:hypothetical protein
MPESKYDPVVRQLGRVALATVFWAGTFAVTRGWLDRSAGLQVRVALVAIGVAGFLPVVLVYAKSIRMQDEFTQRVHLIALAVAFAATACVSYTADLLYEAGFIPRFPSTGLWALMVAVWFVSMLATPRYYR